MTSLVPDGNAILFSLAGLAEAALLIDRLLMNAGMLVIWIVALIALAFSSRIVSTIAALLLCGFTVFFQPWLCFTSIQQHKDYFDADLVMHAEAYRMVGYCWVSTVVLTTIVVISCWANWHRLFWPPLEEKDASSGVSHSEYMSDADGHVYQHAGAPGPFYLKIALRDDPSEEVEVTRLSQKLAREFAPLPREAVRLAVQNGVAAANKQFQTTFHVARIWYREADTPFLALYQHAAEKIIEQLSLNADAILPEQH